SYNRLKLKEGATLLARYKEDPIFAVWECGKGRTAAFAADIAPHGATREFLEWEYFQKLWSNTMRWLAREL
ncbi:MAG: cytoplasmic protein, partial [Candidatus Caldatribacterium sp.]|nr:cytoplasmic protein [Candidatus Caldatribacterium sp.]